MEQAKNKAQVDEDGWVRVPHLTHEQLLEEHDRTHGGPLPTQSMIEAGWAVFDREGLDCPPVETMRLLWTAMSRAR